MYWVSRVINNISLKLRHFKRIITGEQKKLTFDFFKELVIENLISEPVLEVVPPRQGHFELRLYLNGGFYGFQSETYLVKEPHYILFVQGENRRVVTSIQEIIQESYFAWKNSYRKGRADVNYDWRYPDPRWEEQYKKHLDFQLRRAVDLRLDAVA